MQRENQSPNPFKGVIFQRMLSFGKVYDQTYRIHRFLKGLSTEVKNKALHHYAEHPNISIEPVAQFAQDKERKTDG